jgi:integrase
MDAHSKEARLLDRDGNRKYLIASERRRFRTAAEQLASQREKAFCLSVFYTGCRISEALALTTDRVDLSAKTLIFRTLKQRTHLRYRTIPIPDSLVRLMEELIEPGQHTKKVRIWPISRTKGWRTLKSVMDEAEIRGIQATPKGLRHGFAVACVEKEIPLSTIQKWMGHARAANTAIYLDFCREDERRLAQRIWGESEK